MPISPGRISSKHAGARQTDDGPTEQEDEQFVGVWARAERLGVRRYAAVAAACRASRSRRSKCV